MVTAPAFAAVGAGTLTSSSTSGGSYHASCDYGDPAAPNTFSVSYYIKNGNHRYADDVAERLAAQEPEEDGWAGAVELPRVGVPAAAYLDEKIGAQAWTENATVQVGFQNFPSEMSTLATRADDMTALLKDLLTALQR